MNSQLFAHLEAFDSHDDDSEHGNDLSTSLNAASDADDTKNAANIESPQSRSDVDDHTGIGPLVDASTVYVSIAMAVLISSSCDKESILFLSIFTISFGWLFCWQQEYQPRRGISGESHEESSLQQKDSTQQKEEYDTPLLLPEQQDGSFKKCIQEIHDCRNELSRLLGLIGAPPMGEYTFEDRHSEFRQETLDNIPSSGEFAHVDISQPTPTFIGLENSIAETTTCIVSFLEAHVQVVLTIDKALYWIRTSSGLHWGLGAHSQCVERVERAAMSKELFRARRSNADGKGDHAKIGENNPIAAPRPTLLSAPQTQKVRMDQPQRRTDSSAVLALSAARRNIAHVIINEAKSIANTIKSLEYKIARQCEHSGNRIEDQTGHTEVMHHFENAYLEMPNVIDIAWMKASRKYLVNLLAHCAESFTTWESLRLLSLPSKTKNDETLLPSTQPLQVLNQSTWNAGNLREYLVSHLLLDDDQSSRRLGSIRAISYSRGSDDERKFIVPLLQYQKQLEALDVALWSFQQYVYSQDIESETTCSSNDVAIGDLQRKQDESHHSEEDQLMAFISSEAKMEWWDQVKEISASCQALEADIGNKFFSLSLEDSSQDSEDDDDGFNGGIAKSGESTTTSEPQSYEHMEKASEDEQSKKSSLKSTKTLVFSGEGSKQKRVAKKKKPKTTGGDDFGTGKLHSEGHSSSAPPPIVRDAFAEHQLVRELQNRIRSVAALREEEQVDPSPTEFQATSGADEEEQLSQNAMIPDENSVDNVDIILPPDRTRLQTNEVNSRKTAVTTNIFLGASGSLLEELKRNIVSPDDTTEASDEIVGYNDDAVVATTDSAFFS